MWIFYAVDVLLMIAVVYVVGAGLTYRYVVVHNPPTKLVVYANAPNTVYTDIDECRTVAMWWPAMLIWWWIIRSPIRGLVKLWHITSGDIKSLEHAVEITNGAGFTLIYTPIDSE